MMKKNNNNQRNKNSNKQKKKNVYKKKTKTYNTGGFQPLSESQSAIVAYNRQGRTTAMLSPCALKLATAIADPFNPFAKGVCMSTFPSPPSQKITPITSFEATIGTQGYGFIAISPCLANNGIVAWITNSSYSHNFCQILAGNNSADSGVTSVSMNNLPNPSIDFLNQPESYPAYMSALAGRIIAVGAYTSYSGTALNMGGFQYSYVSPTHSGVTTSPGGSGTTIAAVSSFTETQRAVLDRKPMLTTIFPVDIYEPQYTYNNSVDTVDYTRLVYPYSNTDEFGANQYYYVISGQNIGAPVAIIQFNGVPGQTVHCDLIQHIELTGANVEYTATPSPVDQTGFMSVMNSAQSMPIRKIVSNASSYWQTMVDGLRLGADILKPLIVPNNPRNLRIMDEF